MELHWRSADGHEHCFALEGDRALLGRGPECDLVVHDPEVSAQHLVLAYTEQGWEARDLGSTNGTRLDGVRLTQDAILGDGQRLQIGDTAFEVRDAAPIPPPARVDPQADFPPTPTRPEQAVGAPRPGSILTRLGLRRRSGA